jgi:hypothetical protein
MDSLGQDDAMKTKAWAFWFGVAACCMYAVMTGGLAVSSRNDFGGQRDIRFAEGLESDIWLAPRFTSFGVPFVFHYHGSGKPFGLRIQIWDDSKNYQSIEIADVVLKYRDGQIVRLNDGWLRQLQPYTQYNSSSSGRVQTEMLMLSDQIEEVVVKHADVTVTLKGRLTKVSGEQVAFEASDFFKAESSLGVTTYWHVLASY